MSQKSYIILKVKRLYLVVNTAFKFTITYMEKHNILIPFGPRIYNINYIFRIFRRLQTPYRSDNIFIFKSQFPSFCVSSIRIVLKIVTINTIRYYFIVPVSKHPFTCVIRARETIINIFIKLHICKFFPYTVFNGHLWLCGIVGMDYSLFNTIFLGISE